MYELRALRSDAISDVLVVLLVEGLSVVVEEVVVEAVSVVELAPVIPGGGGGGPIGGADSTASDTAVSNSLSEMPVVPSVFSEL